MGSKPKESSASRKQAQIAEQLFQQTDPLRSGLIDRSNDFISGGLDITSTPAFGALKHSADLNFQRAKDNTIARTAAGGGLVGALADLEGQRASTMTQGAGALYGDELNRALTLGTGITGQSLNSLGQAGYVQAQMAASAAQENAAKAGAVGEGAGAMAGGK